MFGLFNKKSKKTKDETLNLGSERLNIASEKNAVLKDFAPDYKDIISPQKISVEEDHLVIEYEPNKKLYSRFMFIPRHGYPQSITQNWLQPILNLGEVDLSIEIHALPASASIKMLNKEDLNVRSRLIASNTRGNQEQVRDLQEEHRKLEMHIKAIQDQTNSSYFVSTMFNVFSESPNDLNRITDKITDELGDSMARSNILYDRQYLALKHFSLLSDSFEFDDTLRTMDRDALLASLPLLGGKGVYQGGISIGHNKIDNSLEFLNIFHEDNLNYSVSLLGVSGSGKSLTMKIMINRMTTLFKAMFRIIDVEGEYVALTKHLGGANIDIDPESDIRINVCSINEIEVDATPVTEEDQEELEELQRIERENEGGSFKKVIAKGNGEYVYRYVPLKETVNQIKEFCNIVKKGEDNLASNALTHRESDYLEQAIYKVFEEKGITMNPDSLYEKVESHGEIITMERKRKEEPTLSDIVQALEEIQQQHGDDLMLDLLHSLKPFLRTGSTPIFDGQTNLGRNMDTDMNKIRTVNFNMSGITTPYFRNVATHVINNYIWEQFIKNPDLTSEKKLIVADEFWVHVDHDSTISSFERIGRRARKRNGGIIYASQDFQRIANNEKAKGVISNTHTNIFLKQASFEKRLVKDVFQLNSQEMGFLDNPDKGEGVIRIGDQSIWFRSNPTDEEAVFSESNVAKQKEMMKKLGMTQ